jgi:hypothetical protein
VNVAGWANSPRGRTELTVVGFFCLTFAVVPLLTTELYPFSRAPMFADAPRFYCDYAVYGPDDRQITDETALTRLGVQRNYWGNPLGVGVGFEPAPSVDDFGMIAARDAVVETVARRLEWFPDLKYVEVEQRIVAPTDADHVGVKQTERWRVDNPFFKAGGGS